MERPPKKTKVYGKTGSVSVKNDSAATFFVNRRLSSHKLSSKPKPCPLRQPLHEITNSLYDIHLGSGGGDQRHEQNVKEGHKGVLCPTAKPSRSTTKLTTGVRRSTRSTYASTAPNKGAKKARDEREWLRPLAAKFERDGQSGLEIESWENIFDGDCNLKKIAESSFAEVYRITNGAGSSILKLVSLKPPKGRGSRRASAVTIPEILSEVMILDLMADVPGFVAFKGIHLIEGTPTRIVQDAYNDYEKDEASEFPKPSSYPKTQIFVGIEMADAGTDIAGFQITDISQVWDIFLGVVVALAKGEFAMKFEHRDLHEGNVCVKRVRQPPADMAPTKQKANTSGLQVTIIDYTLSRATRDDEVIFRDLEKDADIFKPFHTLQSKMYRRMRMWTMFHKCGLEHKRWNEPLSKFDSQNWALHSPFNNVIWIHYLLEYLIDKVKRESPSVELEDFMHETRKLRQNLNLDQPPRLTGFFDAVNVLNFCLEKEWITDDDVENMESSLLEDEMGEMSEESYD